MAERCTVRGIPMDTESVLAIRNTKPDVWPAQAIDPSKPIKWQTRRVIGPRCIGYSSDWNQSIEPGDRYADSVSGRVWKAVESRGRNKRDSGELTKVEVKCPFGEPGDLLYVREALYPVAHGRISIIPSLCETWNVAHYVAGAQRVCTEAGELSWRWPKLKKLQSRVMPKVAARDWLVLQAVRVERLRDLMLSDVNAEGWSKKPGSDPVDWFVERWEGLNAGRGYSWESNPLVRVLEFMRTVR